MVKSICSSIISISLRSPLNVSSSSFPTYSSFVVLFVGVNDKKALFTTFSPIFIKALTSNSSSNEEPWLVIASTYVTYIVVISSAFIVAVDINLFSLFFSAYKYI